MTKLSGAATPVTGVAASVLILNPANAEPIGIDEITNSVSFSKSRYPDAKWYPYIQKLGLVQDALQTRDRRAVKAEMSKWVGMLMTSDHRVNNVAADELFNFSLMVTPTQECGSSVPVPAGGGIDLVY